MAYRTPVVGLTDRTTAHLFAADAQGQPCAIEVGTPRWFAWLGQAPLFRYQHPEMGCFTARRETRRSTIAWYAYRKVCGRQLTAYLGQSEALTAARLLTVAQQLTLKEATMRAVRDPPPVAS